jgi:capsular exopolysaccharide synthesis family protein
MGFKDPRSSRRAEVDRRKARTDEAYRKVVHRLRSVRQAGSGTVVLVVNAVHGEGGSSVAKRLAGAIVQAESGRVLLVDANLRSPSQHLTFGVRQSPGFSDVTAGGPEVQTAELATSEVGFALLPAGKSQDDPIHLMRESNLASALGELRKSFDWIVVDGPPVTIYSEATTLSSLADATILVVRAESTRAEVADRAKRTVMESGGYLAGAILNRREYHIPDFIYRRL